MFETVMPILATRGVAHDYLSFENGGLLMVLDTKSMKVTNGKAIYIPPFDALLDLPTALKDAIVEISTALPQVLIHSFLNGRTVAAFGGEIK